MTPQKSVCDLYLLDRAIVVLERGPVLGLRNYPLVPVEGVGRVFFRKCKSSLSPADFEFVWTKSLRNLADKH